MVQTFLFGAVFGFILSRVHATDYDTIVNMFLLRDLHLVGVIGGAVVVAAIGFAILKRGNGPVAKSLQAPEGKPDRALLLGSALFGAGWALTGTCPGTALAQLGELKLVAGFTLLGIVGGAALHERYGRAVRRVLGD